MNSHLGVPHAIVNVLYLITTAAFELEPVILFLIWPQMFEVEI